jgi:arylsulfatase A-like enzyme
MAKRRSRVWLAASLLLCALLCAGLAGCRRPEPRSVVLIVVDTLRRDHLQIYGYPRTTAPTLGRLASEGAIFDGFSPTSWTKPAVASILTGLHPVHHQALGFSDGLPDPAVTLAEALKRHGYATVGVAANRWVTSSGFEQGFDELHWVQPEGINFADAHRVNQAVRERLAGLREPFFLYVHYMDPHVPYSPRALWDGSPLPERLARKVPLTSNDLQMPVVLDRPRQVVQDAVDLYDGEVRQADDGIAELLALLKSAGKAESVLVVVVGDHGEEFQEHGKMGHGRSLYGEVLRVPILFYAPGLVSAGGRLGRATLLDVFPTVLDLLRFHDERDEREAGAPKVDGRSRADALRTGEPAASEGEGILFHLDYREGHALAFERDRRKLLLARSPYAKELFDMADDPSESRPRRDDPARGELSEELARFYNTLSAHALPRRLAQVPGEDAKKLQAIGYVGAQSRDPEPREIPRRIKPASPQDGGPVGWENLSALASCVELKDPAHAGQLLRGWYGVESGGRWTDGRATLALPGQGGILNVAGGSHQPGLLHLRMRVDGRAMAESTVASGASFFLMVRLQARPDGSPHLVALESDPPFLPSSVGSPDPRKLGAFFTSICLEP